MRVGVANGCSANAGVHADEDADEVGSEGVRKEIREMGIL